MVRTFYRDRFTWLAYFLLAFFSYFLNILGPITPFLKSELHLSYTISSLHFTAFASGILLIGFGGNWIISRIGRWLSLWIGAFGMSLGAILLMIGNTPVVTIGAAFLMSSLGSLILIIVPAALSENHGDLRAIAISESNVISSLISSLAPLLVGFFASRIGDWRFALGVMVSTPIILYLGFGRGIVLSIQTEKSPDQSVHQPLPILFWLYWVAIVLAVSIEFCMISWCADYLENILGMMKASSSQSGSLFLGGMIIGRLSGSRLVRRFSTTILIKISILLAGLGFILFWMGSSVPFALFGLFITGFGVASMYPLILSLAMGAAGKNSVNASSMATLASGAAILLLPLALGRLADGIGIGSAYGIVIILLVMIFFVIQVPVRLLV